MRSLQYIFIFLALTIVIGHSVFVHTHGSLQTTEMAQGHESPVTEFLKTLFSTNVGGEHLEDFSPRKYHCNIFLDVFQASTFSLNFVFPPSDVIKVPIQHQFFSDESPASYVNFSKRVDISRGSPLRVNV